MSQDLAGGSQGQFLITLLFICDMLRVIVKDGDTIEKALKQFKRKTMNTKLIKELRNRQEFEKPSVTERKKKLKARYVQKLRNESDM